MSSKTISSLKNIEKARSERHSFALNSAGDSQAKELSSTSKDNISSKNNISLTLILVVIVILFGFNLIVFLTLQNNVTDTRNAFTKLSRIEGSLNLNTNQLKTDLTAINLQLKNANTEIEQLTKNSDVQTTVIENLRNFNNNLIKELNSLQIRIDQISDLLSQRNGAKGSAQTSSASHGLQSSPAAN